MDVSDSYPHTESCTGIVAITLLFPKGRRYRFVAATAAIVSNKRMALIAQAIRNPPTVPGDATETLSRALLAHTYLTYCCEVLTLFVVRSRIPCGALFTGDGQGQHEDTFARLPASRLQNKLNRRVLSGCDRHFLFLFAQLLVPDFHRMGAGGHVLESERSILAGYRIVGMLGDDDPGAHPLMHVAAHTNPFFATERDVHARYATGHGPIDGLVLHRPDMHVV